MLAWTRDFPAALRALDEALNLWPDNLTFIADKALSVTNLAIWIGPRPCLKGVQPRAEAIVSIIAIADQAELRRRGYPDAIASTRSAASPRGETDGSASYTASVFESQSR